MPVPDWGVSHADSPVLTMRGISKAFGHVQALLNADLDLYPGEVTALLGDNGAGKSTLVKILSGVHRPDSGKITVEGRDVEIQDAMHAGALGIATVFQDLNLIPNRDVASNIYLGVEPRRFGILIDYARMRSNATSVLASLQIVLPSVRAMAEELSGGQRQAVAISRALARGGRIIIMDEPTAALGVEQQEKVKSLIARLSQDGYAILLITHNMAHVFEVAHRIVVLRRGERVGVRAIAQTTREEVVGLITGAIPGITQ